MFVRGLAALCLLALISTNTFGAYSLRAGLRNSNEPVIGNASLFVGATVELDLYLVNDTDTFSLSTARFNISQVGGPNAPVSNQQGSNGLVFNAPNFSGAFLNVPSQVSAGGLNFVKLGQVDITPAIGASYFQFNDQTGGNDFSTASGPALVDGDIIPSPLFAVNAVPEPTSFGLLSVAGLALLRRRKR